MRGRAALVYITSRRSTQWDAYRPSVDGTYLVISSSDGPDIRGALLCIYTACIGRRR